ncbi:4-coumarate-CoA ligase [Eremomyces bilateralis CBS 781.70]|uniref:4-coumarate-CoA ligase n=1 Tax=Eremomyces bilateralis CBS 781.70 TaxID=1392243 RepID=A0A6G1G4G4_9PEZI|nr:4-coumarate-CoA ligase [Eremomyces bilateralis CBS 781.70]KAF1812719.1 4-coumarate-CoA ligase [Eremomyces bilateralis CBS 781.70]
MSRIYRNPRTVDIPDLDILTLLFDSEHCATPEDARLHSEATNPNNYLTKATLRETSEKIAHGLRSQYGIGANGPNKDAVVVFSTGQPLAAALLYGVVAAGGVFSAASPSFTPPELARQIKQGLSNLLVCSPDLESVAVQAAEAAGLGKDRVLVLQSSPTWSLAPVQGSNQVISSKRLTWKRITDRKELEDSLAILLYSSGTTGEPKGVMVSHRNLVAELILPSVQGREWAAKEIEAGRTLPEGRTLAHLPIAHIAGVFGYLISPLFSGSEVCWMRKFEWKSFLELNKKLKITVLYTVPSIYLRMAKSPDVTDHFKYLQAAITGAAPMDEKLQKAANSRLGEGETHIAQTWGLSETTGAVTTMPRGEYDDTGSISPLLPNIDLRIVDDDMNDVAPGQEGELILRGPVVTRGYFRNPEATRDAFRDGWFCTGDIGVDRGGKFYVVDRKKELLKYKGLQIAPAELENTLITHPAILEAAVCGVADEGGSEVPRAYVVADQSKINEQGVKDFIASRLAPYKQLRGGVVFVDVLPKNAIGKLLRRELRERAKKELKLTSKL